jgi:uncharacterized protein (TIGR03083 family)
LYNSLDVHEEGVMIQDLIAEQRTELAAVLTGLTDEQWDAPSLCEGWAVRHVVAHVTMPFRYSMPKFLRELAKAGGSFQKMSDGVASRDAELPRAELIAALRDNADNPWRPPGGGYEAALTHDVIHGLDITRALGIERAVRPEAIRTVLDLIAEPKTRGHFGVELDGVELQATDLDWSSGSGAPLRGRAEDLALVLTGRRIGDDALDGAGARLRAGSAGR